MHAVVVMQARCGAQQGLKELGYKTMFQKMCLFKNSFKNSSSRTSMFLAVT